MIRRRPLAAAQRRAAAPDRSAWVAASAGTGKTKVLVDRLLNLLVAGTRPQRLLCLTFTKVAAQEMALRLARILRGWTTIADGGLTAELRTLTGSVPDDETRRRARRLFVEVLDAPGGLRIDTIHAFCQSLLRRFPLEARLPPNFQVLDERSAAELVGIIAARRIDQQPERIDKLVRGDFLARLRRRIAFMLGRRRPCPGRVKGSAKPSAAGTPARMAAGGLMHGSCGHRLDAGKQKDSECKAGMPHRVETRFIAVNSR